MSVLHPRYALVTAMECDLRNSINEVLGRHPNVTTLEIVCILSQSTEQWIRYAIKDERKETGK